MKEKERERERGGERWEEGTQGLREEGGYLPSAIGKLHSAESTPLYITQVCPLSVFSCFSV